MGKDKKNMKNENIETPDSIYLRSAIRGMSNYVSILEKYSSHKNARNTPVDHLRVVLEYLIVMQKIKYKQELKEKRLQKIQNDEKDAKVF